MRALSVSVNVQKSAVRDAKSGVSIVGRNGIGGCQVCEFALAMAGAGSRGGPVTEVHFSPYPVFHARFSSAGASDAGSGPRRRSRAAEI